MHNIILFQAMVHVMLFLHYMHSIVRNSLCKKKKKEKEVILCVYRFQKKHFTLLIDEIYGLNFQKLAL